VIQNAGKGGACARRIIPWVIILAIVASVACRPSVVFIGLPQERYDHNRTIDVVIESGTVAGNPFLLENQLYAPRSSAVFPAVKLKGFPPASDGLPEAVLVPVFTGLLLPLDSRPGVPQGGDREDLLEYLAAGPLAGVGVERPGASGDMALAEREFRPLLDLLGSADALKGSREDVLKRFSAAKIKGCPATVADSRFHPASFAGTLVVRCRQFWFVLFKVPGQAGYSRLVVVPDLKR